MENAIEGVSFGPALRLRSFACLLTLYTTFNPHEVLSNLASCSREAAKKNKRSRSREAMVVIVRACL